MPRKCVNDVDSFCYLCCDFSIKFNLKTFHHLLRKHMSSTLGAKQVIRINLGLLTLSVPSVQCI
jgi:hypothetical protein